MNPRYLFLYIPALLSLLLSDEPIISYGVAWLGSFWIYGLTFTGLVKKLPTDRPVSLQIFRPFFLMHLIFTGYMAVTSIFYFIDALGYIYLDKIRPSQSYERLTQLAYCQFLYCLGHAAYIHGILVFATYKTPKWAIQLKESVAISSLFFKIAALNFIVSVTIPFIPSGSQFSLQFSLLTATFAIFSLGYAILEKKVKYIFLSGLIFIYGETQALLSGWKEFAIIPLILLSAILWGRYKKTILFSSPLFIFLFFFVIPYYTGIVRDLSWDNKENASVAAQIAITKLQEENIEGILQKNWEFLAYRLSEMKMFVVYTTEVPINVPYKTEEILTQSLETLIPRVFYPNKPIVENMVMERVYEIGVIQKGSGEVSAKPAFIADAYVVGGELGVLVFLFALGALASFLSSQAESLFGGYAIGSGCVFLALYYVMLRGNCFEYITNSVFFSTLTMYIISFIGRKLGYIVPNPDYSE